VFFERRGAQLTVWPQALGEAGGGTPRPPSEAERAGGSCCCCQVSGGSAGEARRELPAAGGPGGVGALVRRGGGPGRAGGFREGRSAALGELGARFPRLGGTRAHTDSSSPARGAAPIPVFGGLGLALAAFQIIGVSSRSAKAVLETATAVRLFAFVGLFSVRTCNLKAPEAFFLFLGFFCCWGALSNASLMSSSPLIFLKVEDG